MRNTATNMHRILADLIFLIHLAYIVFVLFGALLVFRWTWVRWIHVPAVLWAVFVELTGRICPLTPWENWLREAGGGQPYTEGFIEHYLVPLVYPANLTRELQVGLGVGVVVLNGCLYALLHSKRRIAREG